MTDLGDMSMEDALAHYGVLGMKWGKNRAHASAVQIRAARGRVSSEAQKVRTAERKAAHIADPKHRALALKEFGKTKAKFLNNPDRVIAARMTRGEKIAGLIILNGTGLGLGAIVGTSAHSRVIERRQETGKYKAK